MLPGTLLQRRRTGNLRCGHFPSFKHTSCRLEQERRSESRAGYERRSAESPSIATQLGLSSTSSSHCIDAASEDAHSEGKVPWPLVDPPRPGPHDAPGMEWDGTPWRTRFDGDIVTMLAVGRRMDACLLWRHRCVCCCRRLRLANRQRCSQPRADFRRDIGAMHQRITGGTSPSQHSAPRAPGLGR